MREIKFRGKSSWGSPNWVYGNLIQNSDGGFYIIPKEEFLADGHHLIIDSDAPHWVTPETVGQFTGLKGKNGKEIYEGDILLIDEFLEDNVIVKVYNTVGIKDGCFGYIGENNGKLLPFCDNRVMESIAGNIYDNPELILNPKDYERK